MVSMENTITWPDSILVAQASVILKFSKSKNRPSWQGMNSTGRPAWPYTLHSMSRPKAGL